MHGANSCPSRRLVKVAFVLMAGVYFFAYFQRAAVPGTIFNELQQEWHLSASAIVALGSVALWIYGALQLVAGILTDRLGGTRMLLLGGAITAVGLTLFSVASTPGWLYAWRAFTAVGDSCIYLCIAKEISLLFPRDRFARLTGGLQFCGVAGGMMAMLPFERAAHRFGWHASLAVMGGLMGVVMVLNWFVLPKLKHFTPPTTAWSLQPLWDIIRSRRNWPMLINASLNFGIYFTLQVGIGKKFLQDFVGLSSKQAATFTLTMMTVTAVACLLSGYLLYQTGGRRKPYLILSVGLLIGALTLLLVGVLRQAGAWVFLTGYVLVATANIAGPIGGTVMKELNDDRHVGQALALLNTLAYFGVAVLLTLAGTVLDLFRTDATRTAAGVIYPPQAYATLFGLLAGLALVSLVATCFVTETCGAPASAMPVATEIL